MKRRPLTPEQRAAHNARMASYFRRHGPFLTMSERDISEHCLNCSFNECIGIEKPACPIRVEQRRRWRENGRLFKIRQAARRLSESISHDPQHQVKV